jgi:DNA-directed RNA polymerase subunit RPC12/RpoP
MYACANCKSKDVQATVQQYQCLECGRLMDVQGNLVSLLDQYGPDNTEVTDGE